VATAAAPKVTGLDASYYYAKDLDRATKFYTNLLGMEPSMTFPGMVSEWTFPNGETFGLYHPPRNRASKPPEASCSRSTTSTRGRRAQGASVEIVDHVEETPVCFMGLGPTPRQHVHPAQTQVNDIAVAADTRRAGSNHPIDGPRQRQLTGRCSQHRRSAFYRWVVRLSDAGLALHQADREAIDLLGAIPNALVDEDEVSGSGWRVVPASSGEDWPFLEATPQRLRRALETARRILWENAAPVGSVRERS